MRRLGVSGSRCNELEGLGQQFGSEALYSAWKSPDLRKVCKSGSDISRLFGRLRLILTLLCREHAERHVQAACNDVIDRKEERNKHDA
jgi:hypothetical protein